jgi:hypothetical protein
MTRSNFPKIYPDGSFCVEIRLAVTDTRQGSLGSTMQDWINESWIHDRSTWRRQWRTGPDQAVTEEQILHYQDEFRKPPEVALDGSELRLRLLGKQSAKYWRDWLVSRLIPDLKAKFPELGDRLSIKDCRSESRPSGQT